MFRSDPPRYDFEKNNNLLSALECVEAYNKYLDNSFKPSKQSAEITAQKSFLRDMKQRLENFNYQVNIIKSENLDEIERKVKEKMRIAKDTKPPSQAKAQDTVNIIEVEKDVTKVEEEKIKEDVIQFKKEFEDKKLLLDWQSDALLEHMENELNRIGLESLENKHYKELLQKLSLCVEAFKKKLNEYSDDVYEGYADPIIQLKDIAEGVGATVKMYSQVLDLITGDNEGLCKGLVFNWIKHIKTHGYAKVSIPISKEISLAQKNKNLIVEKFVLVESRKLNCREGKLEKIINQFLSNESENTFLWTLDDKRKTRSAHAIGLRKLKTGHIELFEPNMGHFVFKDRDSLINWFRHLLFTYRMKFDCYFEHLLSYTYEGKSYIVEEEPSLKFDEAKVLKPITAQDIDNVLETFNERYNKLPDDLTPVECFGYLLDVLPSCVNRINDIETLKEVKDRFGKTFADNCLKLVEDDKQGNTQTQPSFSLVNLFSKKTPKEIINEGLKVIEVMLEKREQFLNQPPQQKRTNRG